MITMDVKGQLSAEYVLFLGFLLLVILIIVTVATDQSEQNIVASATRLGAVNATTDIVISSNNALPIRVGEITMNGSNPINVTIHLSQSVTNTQKAQILSNVNQSLASQSYSPNYINGDTQITLNTSKHNYLITIIP